MKDKIKLIINHKNKKDKTYMMQCLSIYLIYKSTVASKEYSEKYNCVIGVTWEI